MRAILRRLFSSLASPFRRFFDPRFQAVYDLVFEDTRTAVDATAEASSITGRILHDLSLTVDSAGQRLERIEADLGDLRSRLVDAASTPADPLEERVVVGYVTRALAELDGGSRILGWGPTGDVVWSVLDALGYDVTPIDPTAERRPHPSGTGAEFLAAVWLRGESDGVAVEETLHELSRLTAPGAGLVVINDGRGRVAELLPMSDRWRVEDARVLERDTAGRWQPTGESSGGTGSHVELITGRRDGESA